MLFKKFLIPPNYTNYLKRLLNRFQGDVFSNPCPITDKDFEQIRIGIDEVIPKIFIEIGTGRGVSTRLIFNHLAHNYPECQFWTIEVFRKYYKSIMKLFGYCSTFHPLWGLSVCKEETTPPAYNELKNYTGPFDILRKLFGHDLKTKKVDIAFIDSRKGSALAEFLILEKNLSERGIIFCHDVLNNGKGVEVLNYLEKHLNRFDFEVIETGPMGMIKIRHKKNS
jgi:predicted O-methyltransferase YrrM